VALALQRLVVGTAAGTMAGPPIQVFALAEVASFLQQTVVEDDLHDRRHRLDARPVALQLARERYPQLIGCAPAW
jgi:hypothetical protein